MMKVNITGAGLPSCESFPILETPSTLKKWVKSGGVFIGIESQNRNWKRGKINKRCCKIQFYINLVNTSVIGRKQSLKKHSTESYFVSKMNKF